MAKRRTNLEWQSLFEQYESSSVTQRAFCEEHGLSLLRISVIANACFREMAVRNAPKYAVYPRSLPNGVNSKQQTNRNLSDLLEPKSLKRQPSIRPR